MTDDRQAGFFLWETVVLSFLLLAMAVTAGMYVKVAEVKTATAAQGGAVFIARAEFAYAEAWLERNGSLPESMAYLGNDDDLRQNGIRYEVAAQAWAEDGLWQLTVEISWEAEHGQGRRVYKRYLARHG
ncbi:hypothetical protein [Selenomonas ruminantium]|uniref:hypothetical protein n=1 Tax=Selenomonas ruminantium TaxID=971 RepID=UPI00047A9D54|nr:hypothetical protein [Selenomonas ruminantium]